MQHDKQYTKPFAEIANLNHQGIICASDSDVNGTREDYGEPNEILW